MRQIHLIAVAVFTATGLYLAYMQYRRMDQKIKHLERALSDTSSRDGQAHRRSPVDQVSNPGMEGGAGAACPGEMCPVSEPSSQQLEKVELPIMQQSKEEASPLEKETRSISHLETQYSNFQMGESDNEADVESDGGSSSSDSSVEGAEESDEESNASGLEEEQQPELNPDEHGLPELNIQDIKEMDELLASPKNVSSVVKEDQEGPANLPAVPSSDLSPNEVLEETESNDLGALKKMTVSQLRAEIRNRGGDLRSRMKKPELIALYAGLL